MKRKTLSSLIATLFIFSSVLSACGGNNGNNKQEPDKGPANPAASSNASPAPKVEEVDPFSMTLRHTQVGEAKKFRLAILEDAVKKTEADVPGLKIEFDPVEDNANRFTKLPAEMTAGNPPEIFDLFGGVGDAQKYAAAGRLLDLTPILEKLGIKDSFIDLSSFTYDGKVYGLPIGSSQEGFFYNQELFDKYGLKEPKTWEELENIMATLKQNKITPIAMASKAAWIPLMLANTLWSRYAGPDVNFGFENGAHKWNEPEMVAALTKYDEWLEKGYFMKGELGYEYAEMRNQIITGKAGISFDGIWSSSTYADPAQAGDMVGKIGYFPMPAVPGGKGDQTYINANHSNGYGFSSDLNENEKKAVEAFIKNLYNEEFQKRGLKEDNLLPSMKVEGDMMSLVTDPMLKSAAAAISNAGGTFPVFDALVPSEVNKQLEIGIQQLIARKTTPQKLLDEVQVVQEKANSK